MTSSAKSARRSSLFLSAAVALPLFIFSGCEKHSSTSSSAVEKSVDTGIGSKAPKIVPASPTGYAEVVPYLNAEGSSLSFYDSRQIMASVKSGITSFQGILKDVVMKAEGPEAAMAISAVVKLYEVSGIESIAAVGTSSIPRSEGLGYLRSYIRFAPGAPSNGAIWNLLGKESSKFETLPILPASTALASGFHINLPWLDSTITEVAATAGQSDELAQWKAQIEQVSGLKWAELLGSLGDEMAFAIFLDPSKALVIPIPGSKPFSIPSPSAALVFKTSNGKLFETISRLAQQGLGAPVEQDGIKFLSKAVPNEIGADLSPTLASYDNLLILSSSKDIPFSMKAAKEGKTPGLLKSAEFESLSKDVALDGNMYSFVGRQFGEIASSLINRAMEEARDPQMAAMKPLMNIYMNLVVPQQSFAVAGRNGQDWLISGNGPQGMPAQNMSQVSVVAMLAAIAVPNFLRARERSQATVVINDARMLDAAADQYAIENNIQKGTPLTFKQLAPYLKPSINLVKTGGCDTFGRPFTILPYGEGIKVNPATIDQFDEKIVPAGFFGEYE